MARYSDLVFVFPAAMAIGAGLGYFLEQWWGTYPWVMIVCLFLGIAAGFYQVFRVVVRRVD